MRDPIFAAATGSQSSFGQGSSVELGQPRSFALVSQETVSELRKGEVKEGRKNGFVFGLLVQCSYGVHFQARKSRLPLAKNPILDHEPQAVCELINCKKNTPLVDSADGFRKRR